MQKEISVVIPTYNREESLRECLKSLLTQDYPKGSYEIIVVDDGSTDGTNKLLLALKKQNGGHLIYLRQKHSGIYRATNLGINHAKGKIIAFSDDDCIIQNDWLRKIAEYHNRYPQIMAIQGRVLNFYKDSVFANIEQDILDTYWSQTSHKIGDNNFVSALDKCNSSFKSGVFKDKEIYFNEMFILCGDVDFATQLLKKGVKILYISDIVVFHKHRNTLSSFIKRSFCRGKGQAMVNYVWRTNNPIPNKNIFFSINFFYVMTKSYLANYKLKGLILICLHLLRKFMRILGYFYQRLICNYIGKNDTN